MDIGFLTCPGTHPGSATRRKDAYEHDLQVQAIRPELEARGHALVEIDWRSPVEAFAAMPLVLVGTPWDYQDSESAFLEQLEALEAAGRRVCNSSRLVRWNARKTYLRDLASRGVPTIETLWVEEPTLCDIEAALAAFGTDAVVVKRQVGAGAEGQSLHRRDAPESGWTMDQPAMIQPFLPQIQRDGEFSFLFVDGAFSHAVRKRPRGGDYRVQSVYGGTEEAFEPAEADRGMARTVIEALPFDLPLYARIDMVRADDGALLLMEAELIEPFLYPRQGPQLGAMLAEAIDRQIR